MALRRSDHALNEASVRLLELGASGKLPLGVSQAQGEGVADALELAGREHSRAADRADPPIEPRTGEGGGEELTESAVEVLTELSDIAKEVEGELTKAKARADAARP